MKPRDQSPIDWLHRNGHIPANTLLPPETRGALIAIAWCFELYASDEVEGQEAALSAVRNLLNAIPRTVWPLARALIIRSLDEREADAIWPIVAVEGLYARGEGREEERESETAKLTSPYGGGA